MWTARHIDTENSGMVQYGRISSDDFSPCWPLDEARHANVIGFVSTANLNQGES